MSAITDSSTPVAPPRARPPAGSPTLWRRMKRLCLRGFQTGLDATGAASLYVRLTGASGATILMFHSVARPDYAGWMDPRFHLEPKVFERQMRFLSRRRRPVSMTRLIQALEEGRDLPPRSVAVTFDDGYLDHLTVAAPILVKYGIPATFFLPTGYVTRSETQWVDRLHSCFRRRSRQILKLPEAGSSLNLDRPAEHRTAFRSLECRLLTTSYEDRNAVLEQVEDQLRPEGRAPRLTMDWSEVKALRRMSADFEVGGHTRNHIDVSSVAPEEAGREISGCAEDLRRELGEEPGHFSFPYERWTPASREDVRRAGFRSGCGTGRDVLVTPASDRFALPRLDPVLLKSALGFATSGAHPRLSMALTGRA